MGHFHMGWIGTGAENSGTCNTSKKDEVRDQLGPNRTITILSVNLKKNPVPPESAE